MTTLTVWKFDSEGGARNALQVLERLQKQELIQIVDGAIVTWPPARKKPKTEQLRSLTGGGRARWRVLGSAVRAAVFHPAAGHGDRRGNGRVGGLDE